MQDIKGLIKKILKKTRVFFGTDADGEKAKSDGVSNYGKDENKSGNGVGSSPQKSGDGGVLDSKKNENGGISNSEKKDGGGIVGGAKNALNKIRGIFGNGNNTPNKIRGIFTSESVDKLKANVKSVLKKTGDFFNFGKDGKDGGGENDGKDGVDYISGGEALPRPLVQSEEIDAVVRLQNGDMSAKTELIEHNLRLVVYIAKRFENTGVDIEDLISVGTIGLIKGVNSFNLEKNIKLATYASRCIENEILMHLRKISKIKSEVSLDEPLNVDWEGNMLLLGDILGTEPDGIYKNIENSIEKDMLLESYKKLSDREKLIIRLRFGILGADEKTQKEIAEMMGISQSYISRLEKKIILRLKKEMAKMAK
jgi:RNA polymerase sporulation-specific sigma factor